mmetsp:Transcript_32683/g.33329  ORF Transcript_32683/g.33329 Transcript_32683/m.33329 type:complete len:217 (-) Transcript_32683:239-889(-)
MYNTHIIISPLGYVIAKYRKIHLFDSPLTGLKESNNTEAGNEPVVVNISCKSVANTPINVCLGLSVCYDLRFPGLFSSLTKKGAEILLIPSAFTMRTGGHWETLLKARAIENQCYVLAAAQAGRHSSSRISYGKSMIVNCWGETVSKCAQTPDYFSPSPSPVSDSVKREREREKEKERERWGGECAVCYVVVDKSMIKRVREGMPIQLHQRPDTYH